MTPAEFRQRTGRIYKQLNEFISSRGTERLIAQWPEWQERFRLLFKQCQELPEVEISLVGGTGAGKSTLLNALIGDRVLPVSNMKACTAAISEVSFAEGNYRGRVEFIPRQSWEGEVALLQLDLRDSRFDDFEDANDVRLTISRTAIDKLRTVYQSAPEVEKEDFDPLNLVEPPEISLALDSGVIEFEKASLPEFRKQIAIYLDSKHRFWPIVKSVTVQGPFAALHDGAKLVDLPGINDPNETREAVTRNHLKTCRFVWIIFNIKRALTKDMVDLMQSDDFLRQIVMDGRADTLTFVGTASDDIDAESGIEEFGLDPDAEFAEIVAARNVAVRKVVLDQLDELAARLARLAKESEEATRLAAKLRASKIVTVSAREFLRMEGLARTNPAGLSHSDETEIPELKRHMLHICKSHGIEAHITSLDRQLNLLVDEINRDIQSQRAMLLNRAEISERQRQETKAAVQAANTFLSKNLKDSRERLAQDLEAGHTLLAERIRRAVDRARHELDEATIRRWGKTHHGTVKAVCRRGGAFVGALGRNDFPSDLCKPIMDGIAFAWSDFFGEKLRLVLEKWTDRLRSNAEDHHRALRGILDSMDELPTGAPDRLLSMFETTQRVLSEVFSQAALEMETKITEKQRTLYEHIPTQVKANMQDAFTLAAAESGSGMKQRMIEILSEHAKKISQVMFDEARDALLNGLRGLNDWICSEFQKMTKSVDRNATLASDDLIGSEIQRTNEYIMQHEQILDELDLIIEQFLNAKSFR